MPDSERLSTRSEYQPAQSRGHRLAGIAARQSGVISAAQLYGIGFSRAEIARLVAKGRLHPIHRGVYAVGHTNLATRGHLAAGILAAGADAFLSHHTAAAVHGLARPPPLIELTVPSPRAPERPKLIVHRTATPPDPAELVRWKGLRVSSVARVLIELARERSPKQLELLITEAIHADAFDLAAVERTLRRHARRPGVGNLRRALEGYTDTRPYASRWEAEVGAWLGGDPEIPEPEHDVHLLGWEVDFLWREQRFALELDGRPWHIAVRDMEKDRRKDTELQRAGIRLMRVGALRWRHGRIGIREDIGAFLGLTARAA